MPANWLRSGACHARADPRSCVLPLASKHPTAASYASPDAIWHLRAGAHWATGSDTAAPHHETVKAVRCSMRSCSAHAREAQPTQPRKATAEAVLERVGAGDCARHTMSELDSAEALRVSLAQALVLEPSLLLDRPAPHGCGSTPARRTSDAAQVARRWPSRDPHEQLASPPSSPAPTGPLSHARASSPATSIPNSPLSFRFTGRPTRERRLRGGSVDTKRGRQNAGAGGGGQALPGGHGTCAPWTV